MSGSKQAPDCSCSLCLVLIRLRRDCHHPQVGGKVRDQLLKNLREVHSDILDCIELSYELMRFSFPLECRLCGLMSIQPKTPLIGQAEGRSRKSGKMTPKRVLEARAKEERITSRRRLGSLKQLTVQPSTRARYDRALEKFFAFFKRSTCNFHPQNTCWMVSPATT